MVNVTHGTLNTILFTIVQDEHAAPQPRRYIPPNHATEFLNRFQRNAGLVASGVAKNLNRVGNYVKDLLNDILN